jgi:putative membrane protein
MRPPPDSTAGPPTDVRGRAHRIGEIALLVAGVVLLVGLVRGVGGATLVANLRLVGSGIVVIVAQEILAVLANTLGWRAVFPRSRPVPPFGRLLAARIAGDAVNYVTPTATLGGELVRARLLRDCASRLDLATAIAVAKLSQTVAQVAFIAAGLTLVFAVTPLSSVVRLGLVAGAAALSALAFAVVLAQRRGMFWPLVRLAARFDRHGRLVDFGQRMRRLDEEIARLHRARRRPFLASCAWFFVGWSLGMFEMALMLWLLDVPVTLERVLAIEVLSLAIEAVLFFVPGKLGTQEGGKVLIFTTLGMDAALGLSVGVLRRIRELAWALLGLVIVVRFQLAESIRTRPAPASPARLPAD